MTDARDRLAALLHETLCSAPPVAPGPHEEPDEQDRSDAARLLADPRTLLAAALATDEGKAALAEAIRGAFGGTPPTCHDQARRIAAALAKEEA